MNKLNILTLLTFAIVTSGYADRNIDRGFDNDRGINRTMDRGIDNDRGVNRNMESGTYYNRDASTTATMDHSSKYSQDTFATPSDQQLNKKIRDDVTDGWLWDSYKGVILNTSNGVVTLEGSVKDADEQRKLTDKISKIEGVKSVKSNLTFKK